MEVLRRLILIGAGIALLGTLGNYISEYVDKGTEDAYFTLDGPLTREKVWNGIKVCLRRAYNLDENWKHTNKVRKRLETVLAKLNRDMLLRDIALAERDPSNRLFDIEGTIRYIWRACYNYFKLVFDVVNPEAFSTIGQMADFIYDAIQMEQKSIISFGYPKSYKSLDVTIVDNYLLLCKARCQEECKKDVKQDKAKNNTTASSEVKSFVPPSDK
jgi:hypothetical protein